jgi:uncharacterized protein YndB with AHSA1/START domain
MPAEPLILEFEVAAAPAHAFEVWTASCRTWWPRSHTVSGDPAAITLESWPGGRIFERARDGAEHDWGLILDWDPPRRLRYRWHLFFDPSQATEVEVTFTPREDRTAVRLEQRGFERFGDAGPPRRAKTEQVWQTIGAAFAAAV